MTEWDKRPAKTYEAAGRVRSAERFRGHVWSPRNRTGRIMRPWWCPVCWTQASKEVIQAHHVDYDRPFLVVWCCTSCHREFEAGKKVQSKWLFNYESLVRLVKKRWRTSTRGVQVGGVRPQMKKGKVPF